MVGSATVKTFWFHFNQNNSGGEFDIDDKQGIGPDVWIEATDADHANFRAKRLGIYFDGVSKGRDCECCGDRWYAARSYSAKEMYEGHGYGRRQHHSVYAHALDGTIHRIK